MRKIHWRPLALLLLFWAELACAPLLAASRSGWNDGVTLYAQRNFKGALEAFRRAYNSGDHASDCCYYQALCYQQLGDVASAKQFYLFTIKTFPATPAGARALQAMLELDPKLQASRAAQPSAPMQSAFSSSQQEYDLPFQRNSRQHMVVNVTVDGHPASMLFDTGAEGCFFQRRYLDKIGLDSSKAVKAGRMAGVGGEIDVYRLDVTLSAGGVTRRIPIYIQDERSQALNGNDHGIELPLLGENFFGDMIYEIDDRSSVIRFTRSSANYNPNDDNCVPYTKDGNNIVVTVKVNGRECDMIFDTGAQSISFSDKQLSAIGMNRPASSQAGHSAGVGGQRDAYFFSLSSVKLGPVEKHDVKASVDIFGNVDKPLLGQTFLNGLRFQIDPQKHVIRFLQ